jgi:phosphatidate phosphatase APP1
MLNAIAAHQSEEQSVSRAPLEVIVYPAFASLHTDLVIEGRIVERKERSPIDPNDGKRRNLKRHLKLLVNREVADVAVTVSFGARQQAAITDDEGYFRVVMPGTHELDAGWHAASVEARGFSGAGPALLVPQTAQDAVISDVDDTLLVTGVTSKRKLLKNSLLLNPTQRKPVERMPELLRSLVDTTVPNPCCVIYLSSTPKQLHSSVQTFLEHHEFPRGVLITKRITGDSSSEGLRDHQRYKLSRLEDIFTRLPQMRFTLLGDDAEADPEIYAEIARRYPERINGIWIRAASGQRERAKLAGQRDVAELIAVRLDCAAGAPNDCAVR